MSPLPAVHLKVVAPAAPDVDGPLRVPAELVGRDRVAAVITHLSRHGFRAVLTEAPAAGQTVRLERAGWPPLDATPVWIDGTQAGFTFAHPPTRTAFRAMLRDAAGHAGNDRGLVW